MPRKREPAWGERDAITGYYAQYRISAAFVIRALRDDTLEWIAVADPKAGRVDDFQIGSEQRVDGFQVKWKRYGGSFTFSDFTKETDSKPSLIAQLADGWKCLQAQHENKRIVVHLVTNQHPSPSSSQLPIGDPPPEPRHFAAFIEQVWKPAHASGSSKEMAVAAVWQTTWEALQRASGLTEEEFPRFVRDCDLDFGVDLPNGDAVNDGFAELYVRDLEHVTAKIFEAVYDPRIIIRLSRDELLVHLGWKDRFEYRNRHYFPVNEVLYQPIAESNEAIENALNTLEGGYVGLLGSPGSGKSTLLTQSLRYFPARVIKYYAFVPDAQSTAIRGEAVNFLHDIVRSIEDAGFRPGETILHSERAHLRTRLLEQMQLLHEDWKKTGRKTILMVDGLDHIPREQHPSRSLLSDLPDATQVPAGVYFVLGTQTDQLDDLPNSVQFAIQRPERRIEIGRLARDSVRKIIQRTDLAEALSSQEKDLVYELSAGHPLALNYLLNELQRTTDRGSIEEVLERTPAYNGQIEEQYHAYWREIDRDDELASLLAIVARLRGVIDLKWIESWASGSVLRRLRRKFAHLFRVEDQNRWYFFHNSFRLYLTRQTATTTSGVFDVETDRALHLEIAAKCRDATEPRWQWEELYYLYRAEAYEQFLERATSDFFREQFLNYRSLEAVRSDITLGIRAAGAQRDLVSLVRLMLIDAEMAQRQANTGGFSLAPILLSFGDYDAAIEHLRDGQRLISTPENVLANAPLLLTHGLENEARHLFDLAEPLDLLSGAKQIRRFDPAHHTHYLQVWASSAIHFRTTSQIIAAIKRVVVEPDRIEADDSNPKPAEEPKEDRTLELRHSLLLRTGLALLEEGRWTDLLEIENALLASGSAPEAWWFALRSRSWLKCLADGDLGKARLLIHETLAKVNQNALSDAQRVTIAEGVLRIDDDQDGARQWIKSVSPIGLQKLPDFNFGFSLFNHLFRHARLLYAFGDRRYPAGMIPEPADPRKLGSVYFQRGICAIAQIWALGWLSRTLDHATIRQQAFPLLRLFYHNWRDTKWDSWHWLVELKAEFYSLLIDAVSLHGVDAVEALAEEFAREWENNSRYWSSGERRQIILELKSAGIGLDWAADQLDHVTGIIDQLEVGTRIEEEIRQVQGCLDLGGFDKAQMLLTDALIDAASVGGKDYQLGEWIEWVQDANRRNPADAANRIAWFAEAVRDLDRNGGPAKDAAYDLIEATCKWSPRRAVLLFIWFFSEGLISFSDAVRRMVRVLIESNSVPPAIAEEILLHFLVPLCNDDDAVVGSVVAHTFTTEGREATIRFCLEFKSAVEVHALGSRRPGWLRGLARSLDRCGIDISEIGLREEDSTPKGRSGTDEGLQLKDGTTLTLAQVKAQAETVAGLRELIHAQGNSFYHWDEIIGSLKPRLTTSGEVMSVVDLFTDQMFSAPILVKLASRLMELGDLTQAKAVARLALSASETSGWAVHLSGGIKIDAFRILTAIGGEQTREEAFDELVRDMSLTRFFEGSTYKYTGATVQYLRDILPLLSESVPFDDVWPEVESYVHNLFPAVFDETLDASLVASLSNAPDSDTAADALVDFLCIYAAHPANLLADCASTTFVKLLVRNESTAIKGVKNLLRGDEVDQESALMMIDSAAQRQDIVNAFQPELQDLTDSPNIALRLVARRLCGLSGIRPAGSSGKRSVPSLYELALPPGSEIEEIWSDDQPSAFDFLPETEDPYQLLKIILIEIKWAASEAGVPEENLVQRTAQIAQKLARKDRWSRLGEKWMRNRLNVADLRYPYRRPRSMIARRAFFHVVAELVDLGLLGPANILRMKPALDYYDPELFFIEPGPTPSFTYRMPDREPSQGDPGLEGSEFPKLTTDDGLVVFGEYSKVKRLEWELPTVVTQTMIAPAGLSVAEDRESFFARKICWLVSQYPDSSSKEAPEPIVIWEDGQMRMFDSPNPVWLAFNPELARSLGWSHSPNLLFGWLDNEGKAAVWSVWWKDGLYKLQPPRLNETVGEGWAVLGTPEALTQLQARLGIPLAQFRRIERSRTENKETKVSLHQDERRLP